MTSVKGGRSAARRLVPLLLLGAIAIIVLSLGWHRHLSLTALAEQHEALKAFIEANGVWAVSGFVLLYSVVVALSIPGGAVLTMAGGLLFGWLVAGLAAVVGATLGATALFLVARTALGEPLARSAGPWLEKLKRGFHEDAWNYLLFLRLVPVFPFWLVNLAPALLDVPLRTYVGATAIGIVPGTFAYAIIGAGLGSVIEAERAAQRACLSSGGPAECPFKLHVENLVSPALMAALIAMGLLALAPVVLKKVRARRQRH